MSLGRAETVRNWPHPFPLFPALTSDVGECRIVTLHDRYGMLERLVVTHADPRALITPSLLEAMTEGGPSPFFSLKPGPGGDHGGWLGWVLTVRGENRTVVYHLSEYLEEQNCYLMEWPD